MKQETREQLDDYYREAESWASDKIADLHASRRRAWIAASVMAFIAIALAIALIALTPLKTVEPYTLLVDRQTGHVETLQPLDGAVITPDEALTRSFLVQYVIARETFDIDTLQEDYRKTVLWSNNTARAGYIETMQASNPQSPLSRLPRDAVTEVEINSISMLSDATAMVRYALVRRDGGGQARSLGNRVSVLTWTYSGEPLTVADRLVNPLGFQVTRYRSDIEALPEQQIETVGTVIVPASGSADAASSAGEETTSGATADGVRRIGNRPARSEQPQ